jgi:amino acid transporter
MLVISSVAFTFISYWRTAAVVLCDLGSSAFYVGGIVEQSIGKAAPWFILAVMFFSYGVRWVYIESCTLFIRGGVYRVVREAMGRFPAKLAVSALIFDYVLTGPISGVSAGQYIIGLLLEVVSHVSSAPIPEPTRAAWKAWGSVALATAVTIYFFRKNVIGIHESSDKAVKIMAVTTVMAIIMLSWCGLTLLMRPAGEINSVPLAPNFRPKLNPTTKKVEDPTGFLADTAAGNKLKALPAPADPGLPEQPTAVRLHDHEPASTPADWLSLLGVIGVCLAFGHSVLAMSGEETLAQVYREVESPKLPNFKKAAFIVFVYSLLFTGIISFLAVMLIPDAERMPKYSDNLIGGLAMNVWAPSWAQPWAPLLLNAFVVLVGFLILSGAVNTAIIGSNGVLNRVAEDGVVPDWFLKPHPKYGTTYRILYLILFLQLLTIFASGGDVIWLGEAYAFGVIWSFVFQALSMTILRFKDRRPRDFKVPLNPRIGRFELPLGLILILLILLSAAIMNLLTKRIATIGGGLFTAIFFTIFTISELYHERKRRGARHEHLEQFNQATTEEVTPATLGLTQPYRKLVAIRSPQNLFMLEKALAETDPETTAVVVMTAKTRPPDAGEATDVELDIYDQQLMTAVVNVAEKAGKVVKPLIVPTNNPLHAVLRMAKDLKAQELIMGASNKYTADEQLEQVALYWMNMFGNEEAPPLTVRLLSRQRDVYLDLNGGNRIPKISERQARSVAELRAAGVGIDRVLLAHDGSVASSDLLQAVLTLLDPDVRLGLILAPSAVGEAGPSNGEPLRQDLRRARKLGRELEVHTPAGDWATEVVRIAREEGYNLIVLPLSGEQLGEAAQPWAPAVAHILRNAHCRVFLAAAPVIPAQTDETPPAV